jgi:hypothetical protein
MSPSRNVQTCAKRISTTAPPLLGLRVGGRVDLDEGLGQISEPVADALVSSVHRQVSPERHQNRRMPLDLGVEFVQQRFEILARDRLSPALERLDVFLRHRPPSMSRRRGVAHPPAAAADQTLSDGDTVPEAVRNLRRYGRADRQLLRPR